MELEDKIDWAFKVAIAAQVVLFVCIVVGSVAIAFMLFDVVDNVSEHGLKQAIERVWEGPLKDE